MPDPVSLSRLRSLRAAMDRAPWSFDDTGPPAWSVDVRGADCRCDDADDTVDPPASVRCPVHEHVAEEVTLPNAAGICATHDAVDVLLDVAEAALAWRAALDEREDFRVRTVRACRDDPSTTTTLEHRVLAARIDEQVESMTAALCVALARVTS